MFKNKKFDFYAVILCLTGFAYTAVCAALESGQIGILRRFITTAGGGWPSQAIELPTAVGSFLAVPAAFLCGHLIMKNGPRQALIVWGAAAALGCVGLMNAEGVYWLFFASMVVIHCACTALRIGIVVLCAQWFIRCRGRVLGLVTMGAPVYSAVSAASMAGFIQTRLGGDARPFYLCAAALLALLALAVGFLLRDRPEDAGLYPDGEGRAPAEAEPSLSVGQLLRQKRFWLVLAAAGALTAAAAGCLGAVETRLLAKGGGGPALLDRAAPWLALGAIFGIPASYIFGWLCDRLGEVWAALSLTLAELGCAYLLWTFPKEVDASVGAPLCLALACLMGGVSTVVPCLIARAFGRQRLPDVCRVLFPALVLLAALAGPAVRLLGGGERARLYPVLMAVAAVGLAAALLLFSVKDANAPDRGRGPDGPAP